MKSVQFFLTIVFSAQVFLSCKNDSTTSKMANDACSCFKPESDDLSDRSRKILIKAFRSNNWERTIADEFGKIKNEEEKSTVIKQLESALNRQSFQKCMNRIDIRYENHRFDEKLARQLA